MQGKINAGMIRESESQDKVGYKSVIDLGRETIVPFPHNLYDYPTKILPQVMGEFVERLSNTGDVVLDPFAGGGPIAVECALRQRRSINIDINPYALQVAQKKLEALRTGSLFESPLVEGQMVPACRCACAAPQVRQHRRHRHRYSLCRHDSLL